jgi:Gas vesicle protein G
MGLLTGLVTLPLAPVRGVAWVVEQVADEADRQLYDEGRIRREMLELELDYEDGKIDEQEREHREEALLERMAISQARRAESEEEPLAWEEEGDG